MKKIIASFFLLLLFSFVIISSPVLAATEGCPAGSVCIQNPLGASVTSPQILIGKVINSIMGLVGSIALLMFIYGGITWMTSAGNSDAVKKGREIVVWAVIGLAVIFLSYGLVKFLLLNIK